MAVKIKLKRIGKKREPHYRIVVADARSARGGRAIEEIGQYHPVENPSRIQVDSERAQHWLSVGAQPTEAVAAILRVTGDWQAFKGEPAPPAMLVAEPKPDKKALFEAAALEAAGLNEKAATTPKAKKKAAPKAAEPTEKAAEKPAPETPDAASAKKPAPEAASAEKPAPEAASAEKPAPEAASAEKPAPETQPSE